MVVVALDPLKPHLVGLHGFEQALPQIRIFYFGPTASLPAVNPSGVERVHHILAVADHSNGAARLEGLNTHYHGHQLHAVVGGVVKSATQFFFVGAAAQNGSVAAGARVALGCPVRKQVYLDHPSGKSVGRCNPRRSAVTTRGYAQCSPLRMRAATSSAVSPGLTAVRI